jgi:type I restriction enzyme M protein
MRHDNNCDGISDYIEHLSWVLLLKLLDRGVRTDVNAMNTYDSDFNNILEPGYCWSEWVPRFLDESTHNNAIIWPQDIVEKATGTGNDLLHFIQEDLLPYLSSLSGSPEKDLIGSVFKGRNIAVCASADNLVNAMIERAIRC